MKINSRGIKQKSTCNDYLVVRSSTNPRYQFCEAAHVFGNRLGTKVPGDATSSIGLDTDARDLVLPD